MTTRYEDAEYRLTEQTNGLYELYKNVNGTWQYRQSFKADSVFATNAETAKLIQRMIGSLDACRAADVEAVKRESCAATPKEEK